ncbi:MAG: sialate O-acetylesterase [Fibromonadaceae bacterium]|jgi:hypothetical protein|nr:sialate O-acetylesterase [Fibromonadaceae bacterium]
MKLFLGFSAILGSLFIFACSSKDNQVEEPSSSSEFLSSSEVSSSSEEVSSSSEEISSSSEEISSSSEEISSSSEVFVLSSSSVEASSSSSAKSSSSAVVASSSSSAKSSSSSVQVSSSSVVATDPKENFHIYLAFGQSNMEGQNPNMGSDLAVKYKQNVDKRFRVMTAVAGSYKLSSGTESRKQGEWYTAVPPLLRNNLGISPADYFGRTLVAGIPDTNIKIGIIAVAVAGTAIEGLEKGSGANSYFNSLSGTYAQAIKQIAAIYDNNPYNRLITLAKEAQKVGVIKGIIMHQGESGAASGNWAQKVKGIYDNLLSDLGLPANSVPFLAGEPVITASNPNQNNATLIRGLTNTMNAKLPNGAPVAYVIPSNGCGDMGDNIHFSYDGYEKLGTRYGEKMLELLYSK